VGAAVARRVQRDELDGAHRVPLVNVETMSGSSHGHPLLCAAMCVPGLRMPVTCSVSR